MGTQHEELESVLRAGRDFRQGLDQLVSAITLAFTPIMQQAKRGLDAFGVAYYDLAERMYLEHHRRLPGSLRTARLKKKRKTKVSEWFEGYLKHTAK